MSAFPYRQRIGKRMKKNILAESKRKRGNRALKLRHDMIAWCLLLPTLICFTFFVWRPTIVGIVYSFYDLKGFEPVKFVGLRNYKVILSNTQFLRTLWNTVQYVCYFFFIAFIPPILVAIMLSEVRFARKTFKFLIYFPAIVPGVVTNLLWTYIYEPGPYGILNRLLGVFGIEPQLWLNSKSTVILSIIISVSWNGLGASMLYYFAALQGVNRDLYEASVIDGAGIFARIKHITFPQISGVVLLMFVRNIISIFQIMEEPLMMTEGGPNGSSMTLGLLGYRYAFEYYQSSYALALGVIEFLMLIGLTVLYFKMSNKIETA